MSLNQALLHGNKDFRKANYEESDLLPSLAKHGQHPKYATLDCVDSRDKAVLAFDFKSGDALTMSSMGALIPPMSEDTKFGKYTETHLNFFVGVKKVKEFLVLGHTDCGAAAAIASEQHADLFPWLVSTGEEALNRTKAKMNGAAQDSAEFLRALEKEMLKLTYENALTYPVVQEALKDDEFKIVALINDLETGALYELTPKTGKFSLVNDVDGSCGGHDGKSCCCES